MDETERHSSSVWSLPLSDDIIAMVLESVTAAKDFVNCEMACKYLRQIVQQSARIQYLRECFLSGRKPRPLGDGPSSTLLSDLRASEEAWSSVSLDLSTIYTTPVSGTETQRIPFQNTVWVLHQPERRGWKVNFRLSIHDLVGGTVSEKSHSADTMEPGLFFGDPSENLLVVLRVLPSQGSHKNAHISFFETASSKELVPHSRAAKSEHVMSVDMTSGILNVIPRVRSCQDYVAVYIFGWIYLIQWTSGLHQTIDVSDLRIGDVAHISPGVLLLSRESRLELVAWSSTTPLRRAGFEYPRLASKYFYRSRGTITAASYLPQSHVAVHPESVHATSPEDHRVVAVETQYRNAQHQGGTLIFVLRISALIRVAFLGSDLIPEAGGTADVKTVAVFPWLAWGPGSAHVFRPKSDAGSPPAHFACFGSRFLFSSWGVNMDTMVDHPPVFCVYEFSRRASLPRTGTPALKRKPSYGETAYGDTPLRDADPSIFIDNVESMPFIRTKKEVEDWDEPEDGNIKERLILFDVACDDEHIVLNESHWQPDMEDPTESEEYHCMHVLGFKTDRMEKARNKNTSCKRE